MKTIDELYNEWRSLQPMKKEYQQHLDEKFMLEFNYNSNHIEGNIDLWTNQTTINV